MAILKTSLPKDNTTAVNLLKKKRMNEKNEDYFHLQLLSIENSARDEIKKLYEKRNETAKAK